MESLFDINNKILELLQFDGNELIDEETGEVFDIREELDKLDIDRNTKITSLALFVQKLDNDAESYKAKAKSIVERAKSKENKASYLRNYLIDEMTLLGDSKFENADVKISIRQSERINIIDEAIIAPQFWREKVTKEVSKTDIKDAIKAGQAVDGAELVKSKSLTIK